ncbi:hypothetical protein GCM10009716_00720 [Streptomyces sodiiphilus]|uniref:Uncharacterized protein n=1 Tax=Streptomyces sodiiphilus TaxID=226217 RepID=A0ABN2NQI7_9ACTN
MADTDSQTSGWALRRWATTVLLPTPEGPESTVSLGRPAGDAGVDPGKAAALMQRLSRLPGSLRNQAVPLLNLPSSAAI